MGPSAGGLHVSAPQYGGGGVKVTLPSPFLLFSHPRSGGRGVTKNPKGDEEVTNLPNTHPPESQLLVDL